MDGEMPARVGDAIIEGIRERERRGAIELPRKELRQGAQVRIVNGPFIGQLGLCAGMAQRERVEILLALLGDTRRVILSRDDIEAGLTACRFLKQAERLRQVVCSNSIVHQ